MCACLAAAVSAGARILGCERSWEFASDGISRHARSAAASTRRGAANRSPSPSPSPCCGAAVQCLRLRGGFDVISGGQGDFVREVMEVPADRIGIIIGRQGGTIREIGRLSGVNLWVDQKTNLPGMWRMMMKPSFAAIARYAWRRTGRTREEEEEQEEDDDEWNFAARLTRTFCTIYQDTLSALSTCTGPRQTSQLLRRWCESTSSRLCHQTARRGE